MTQAETPHEILLTKEQIAEHVRDIARSLEAEYCDTEPVLLGVLNAAYMFVADLSRELEIPHTIGFVEVAGYCDNVRQSLAYATILDPPNRYADKDVIIVDTMVDTARTLHLVYDALREYQSLVPRTVASVAMVTRERAELPAMLHRTGIFYNGNQWLVGYGLDDKGRARHLKKIITIDPPKL